MTSAREIVFQGLCGVNLKGGFSNLTLDRLLRDSGLSAQDRAFASALFYGVIERKITLDYYIRQTSSVSFSKLSPKAVILLEMGLYQILYMDSVPESAAVNETVGLCKTQKLFSLSGFINANLRGFLRKGVKHIERAWFDNQIEYFSVKYSIRRDLVSLLLQQYPAEQVVLFLEKALQNKATYIRLNQKNPAWSCLAGLFQQQGVPFQKISEYCLRLGKTSDITSLPGFQDGLFYVQDLSSQICAEAVAPQPSDRIIDACSAPGSKAFTMAQYLDATGEILAFDIHPKRIALIQKTAKRLGIQNIKACLQDGRFDCQDLHKSADAVLCDVPCSGLGTIGRKPEIKYKALTDIEKIYEIQQKILCNCAEYVKISGKLIYSTCSVNRFENEMAVETFLKTHPNFVYDEFDGTLAKLADETKARILFMGGQLDTDGFFICRMRRIS